MGDYMRYIFLISRFASFVIDYLLLFLLTMLLAEFNTIGYILSLMLFFLYRYLTTAFYGATLGMKIFKLRLKYYDKKICFKREIYRFASAFFYVGYLYALIDGNCRTFHDILSDTAVVINDGEIKRDKKEKYIKIVAVILLIISTTKWTANFILNDVGFIGLEKKYISDLYFQSFEGDKLISLSQDELYMKSLGRKYTTVVDINHRPSLIRISNKLKYSEIYKLNLKNSKIVGEYMYKIKLPIQYLCSGVFLGTKDMCGISPEGDIVLINQRGKIYGKNKTQISNILSLKCGDIDMDGKDESVILGRGGDIEIFKLLDAKLKSVYFGKFGEDIMPISFLIDRGIFVLAKGSKNNILYFYKYKDNKFKFVDKKEIGMEGNGNIYKLNDMIVVSNINRNNMTFRRGEIQRLEVYAIKNKINRVYNFGDRPGRRYAYMVRNIDDIYDIDGDGKTEIIFKAVGSGDVNGQGYRIEIYGFNKYLLILNRVLTLIENVMNF